MSPTHLHHSDPRLRLAYDLYNQYDLHNQGLAQGLAEAEPTGGARKRTAGARRGKRAEVRVEAE